MDWRDFVKTKTFWVGVVGPVFGAVYYLLAKGDAETAVAMLVAAGTVASLRNAIGKVEAKVTPVVVVEAPPRLPSLQPVLALAALVACAALADAAEPPQQVARYRCQPRTVTHAQARTYVRASWTWRGQIADRVRALESTAPCADPALAVQLAQMNATLNQILVRLQTGPPNAVVTDPAVIALLNQLNANQGQIVSILGARPLTAPLVVPGGTVVGAPPLPQSAAPMLMYHYHYWVGPLLPQGAPPVPGLLPSLPTAPLVPGAPVVPLTPGAPAVPLVPGAPAVPLVPGAPAVPLTPGATDKDHIAPIAYSKQKTALYRPK